MDANQATTRQDGLLAIFIRDSGVLKSQSPRLIDDVLAVLTAIIQWSPGLFLLGLGVALGQTVGLVLAMICAGSGSSTGSGHPQRQTTDASNMDLTILDRYIIQQPHFRSGACAVPLTSPLTDRPLRAARSPIELSSAPPSLTFEFNRDAELGRPRVSRPNPPSSTASPRP